MTTFDKNMHMGFLVTRIVDEGAGFDKSTIKSSISG